MEATGINFDVDVTRPSVLAPYPFLKPLPARFVFNGKCFVLDFEIYFEKEAICVLVMNEIDVGIVRNVNSDMADGW